MGHYHAQQISAKCRNKFGSPLDSSPNVVNHSNCPIRKLDSFFRLTGFKHIPLNFVEMTECLWPHYIGDELNGGDCISQS